MDCCQPQNRGCSCNIGCCGSAELDQNKESNKIIINFLYLDLNICNRCQGTDHGLEEAIEDVAKVLELTGVEIVVNKIHINSREKAIKHEFVTM